MTPRTDLPADLPESFPTRLARMHGVSRSRLRGREMAAPFWGVRLGPEDAAIPADQANPYARQRAFRVARARQYAPGLHPGNAFSHETAAAIWRAPLPIAFTQDGEVAGFEDLPLHVTATATHLPFPRAAGVTGHRTRTIMTNVADADGLRVTSPAATWASLGTLSSMDLVALGDFFCRVWRPGVGRPNAGQPPLATREGLRYMLEVGRRRGASRLREALELIREDCWSPRESHVRCVLVDAGLEEPQLNIDIFDDHGRFLGCVDMAYPEQKVAIEYHGMQHSGTWAHDVERADALRAARWTVIEVTATLLKHPDELVRRVQVALAG